MSYNNKTLLFLHQGFMLHNGNVKEIKTLEPNFEKIKCKKGYSL